MNGCQVVKRSFIYIFSLFGCAALIRGKPITPSKILKRDNMVRGVLKHKKGAMEKPRFLFYVKS